MKDRTDEDQFLRGAVSWQYKRRETVGRLGFNVEKYVNARRSEFNKNAKIMDAWQDLLPAELHDHCSVDRISSGNLYIEVDPGAYMHELQVMSSELLEQLQRVCRYGGIKRIVLRPRNNKTIQTEEI